MRDDPAAFKLLNESPTKRPRFVVSIQYDVESIYMTSHPGITGVPGIVMEDVLRAPSAISQRIVPDEGRSEIGTFSFSLVDLAKIFTEEVREKLNDGKGLRGKTVRFWVGYARYAPEETGGFGSGGFGAGGFGSGIGTDIVEAVFGQFQLFQTQIITDFAVEDGVYDGSCSDITREQRGDILEPKLTTLRDTIDPTTTTIPVYSTVGFQPVYHGSSYSDAPNETVGYIKVEDEIIRYPFEGITADSFTGCTRAVLNTRAVQHTVDPASEADRRPKVEEVIYLEMPAVKLAYAINTGIIHNSGTPMSTLPPHWHRGIDPALIRLSDFTDIGVDLWDPALDTEGFVVRFQGLKKTDAKKFLETELYMLLGCYSPIYSDGTIGLKRMNEVLSDAAYVVELNERNVVSCGALQHDLSGMHNRLQIDWNWNGERFTRTTLFLDAQSVAIHGEAPLKKLQFKGLHGSRHTEAMIKKRMDAFRDRYTSPPERILVTALPSLNRLEVGDVVRLRLPNVRDFVGPGPGIDRSFEIQRKSCDYVTGDVTFELFGSTARASELAPNDTGGGRALTDAFYSSDGVDLSTVCTITVVGGVGVIQPGTYDLAAGIYYYLADLELANGATLTINGTVQIRHLGFFTINGAINGVGRGKAGQADAAGWGATQGGLSGFLGNSRGMDGVLAAVATPRGGFYIRSQPCAFTPGQYAAVPYFELQVDGNNLLGLPTDLAGTSGGAGGKLGRGVMGTDFEEGDVSSSGGTGADSGAGLILIGRGLAFGASGEIDLSGDSASATSLSSSIGGIGISAYPGAGGAGCPGALLILLDGSGVSLPDLGGKFTAATGTVPVNGTPLPERGPSGYGTLQNAGWTLPGAGYLDESMISAVDLSNVAYRVQFIPAPEVAQDDFDDLPQAPTALAAVGGIGKISVGIALPILAPGDLVEIYSSITNVRGDAVRVALAAATNFVYEAPTGGERFHWARVRRPLPGIDLFSSFFPVSATAGVQAAALPAGTGDIEPGAATDVYVERAKAQLTISTKDTGGDPAAWTAAFGVAGIEVEPLEYDSDIVVTVAVLVRYSSAGATPEWYWNIQKVNVASPLLFEQEYGVVEPIAGSLSQQAMAFRTHFSQDADGLEYAYRFNLTKGDGADASDVMSMNTAIETVEVIKR
jgi:hypothetical protein